ncbi:MAG: fasciclin domain-containing protein [Granulosicoccaceae bacterium]
MRAPKLFAVASLLSISLVACDDSTNISSLTATDDATQSASLGPDNIYNTAVSASDFQILTTALQVTGLDAVVTDPERNFTVFAPTDAAFEALGQDTINSLLNDVDTLSDILLYHVLADTVVQAEAALQLDGQSVETANGDDIALSVDNGKLFINNAEVIIADVGASNGVIHVIDKVLLPPADPEAATANIVETAQAAGSFNTLVAALQATGLDQTLMGEGPFTVFAPSDEAFAKLGDDTVNALLADPDTLSDILLYHVLVGQAVDATTAISLAGQSVDAANGDALALSLNGGNLFINSSQVTATDIAASNGVIHVIDTVLLPPQESPSNTIVDVAKAEGFSTLVAALEAADLADTLADTSRQFTVFAPTDAAFAALGASTIEHLLADKPRLSNILLFHVLADTAVDSASVASILGQPVHAANGDALVFTARDHDIFVQHSKLLVTDVPASNGIIHVIDAVMIPPEH